MSLLPSSSTTREEARKAKELEEARKAGTAEPEKDEEGNAINPHIPQYISKAPWYLSQQKPGLKHQRFKPAEKEDISLWYERGKKKEQERNRVKKLRFEKGACANCGAKTHAEKDCTERPRSRKARYTNENLCDDEQVLQPLTLSYDGKRDRYAGYDAAEYRWVIRDYELAEIERKRRRAQQMENHIRTLKKGRKRHSGKGGDLKGKKTGKKGGKKKKEEVESKAAGEKEPETIESSSDKTTTAVAGTGDHPAQGPLHGDSGGQLQLQQVEASARTGARKEDKEEKEEEEQQQQRGGEPEDSESSSDDETCTRQKEKKKAAENDQKSVNGGNLDTDQTDSDSEGEATATETESDTDSDDESSDEDVKQHDFDQTSAPVACSDDRFRINTRNLRIREDTAKYLLNLDVNSAFYDPKSRSMRGNPFEHMKEEDQFMFKGDNYARTTGDVLKAQQLQVFAWEAYKHGAQVHFNAQPTQLEKLYQEHLDKKKEVEEERKNALLSRYGGREHLEVDRRMLLAQTEVYVEYSRDGRIVKGRDRLLVKSKYEEDVHVGNHTSVFGSWYNVATHRWGFHCCKQTDFNSDCTGRPEDAITAQSIGLVRCSEGEGAAMFEGVHSSSATSAFAPKSEEKVC